MAKQKKPYRTYRQTYKDGKGKTKQVSNWYIELRDHNETIRRIAGFSDGVATEEAARNIVRLKERKQNNMLPDEQLVKWLETIPNKLRNRLVAIGLLDASRIAATKPLLEHLEDFKESLLLHSTEAHVKQTISKIKKILKGCQISFWSEVKVSDIEVYIADRRKQGLSKRTAAYYAMAFGQFSRWLLKEKRINEVPVIHFDKPQKNYGRAFELDEYQRILDAALSGPEREGMSGYERYVCYVLAVETGLRRGEMRSITPASFDFKNNTVFVNGENTKNGEDAVQEFSIETKGLLKEFVAKKMPSVQLFPIPNFSAEMIRADCKAAGVNTENNEGKLKFHSLRHTCGTFLADAGVHPKVIQEIMRHKDINMTMMRYCHTLKGQKTRAVNSFPKFKKYKATGTE